MQAAEIFTLTSSWLTENLMSMVAAVVIVVVGFVLGRIVARAISGALSKSSHADKTIGPLLAQITRYGIYVMTVMLALSQLGVQTHSMLAVIGAAGLAIALALQGTLSNMAAGIMMIALRPISIGHYIEGGGVGGTVTELGLFATRLRTPDGLFVFVPNSQLWEAAITNYTHETSRRFDLKVGIAYDADIAIARRTLLKLATTDERLEKDPAPIVYVDELGDSAVVMLLRVWVPTHLYWDVKFDLTEKTKLAFDMAGVEIPYNKLDVMVKSMPQEAAE